ncbi:hypothetical protein [Alteriqipengyuania sp.]
MWGLLVMLVLLASASRLIEWRFPDPDDILRLVQVRDLLAGQGWFDLDQHRIDPLRDVPMHWSRLVDLPLALVIGGLTPIAGQGAAEAFAVVAVPLLTLLVAMTFTGLVAMRIFGRETGGWAVLVAGMMPLLMHQFQPLRIDHHGWQIACFAAALWGLSQGAARRGPIIAGIAMAWGMMISIEMLPLAGLVAAILALRWLRDTHARFALTNYMQALAGGLIVLYLATRGWPGVSAFCDAITPAHLGFFLVTALGVTSLRYTRPLPALAMVGAFAVIGAGGIAMFAFASPGCVGTPFGALDPVVRDFWYVNVSEGRPIWEQDLTLLIPFAQIVFGFGVTVLLWARTPRVTRGWWLEFALLFAGTLALGIMVTRSLAFASLLATIPFAWLLAVALHRLRTSGAMLTRVAVVVATLAIMLPTAPVAIAQNIAPALENSGGDAREPGGIGISSCDLEASARRIAMLPRGTVFAPLDIGPSILLQTDHDVIATGHHRADKAMRDVIATFVSPPEVSRQVVDAYGATYVVLCTDLVEPSIYASRGGERSLAARLSAGDAPAWLDPVTTGGPETFKVWRVIR